jgi:RHS repeat-associated protein
MLFGSISILPAGAQVCSGVNWEGLGSDEIEDVAGCTGATPPNYCNPPELGQATATLAPGCDPTQQSCSVTIEVPVTYPGNHLNNPGAVGFGYSFAALIAQNQGGGTFGTCGFLGAALTDEIGKVSWSVGCTVASPTYVLTAISCPCPPGPFCPQALCPVSTVETLDMAATIQAACAGPPPPCKKSCECSLGGSGAGPGGRGAGPPAFPGSGPQVLFRYKAGGVGHPGFPGSADWNVTLGRYWSHDGAMRIVEASPGDPSTVWLLDEAGTFTRFDDSVPTAVPNDYETVDVADEYRTLTRTASGWELRDLDGTVMRFDADGLRTLTEDRNGNQLQASYDAAGRLEEIVKPDGRRETFAYYPMGDPSEGKLMAITLWGVLDADTLVWTYEWTGDDLTRIDRPDGRALLFEYDDPGNPSHPDGYMTRARLLGDQGGTRLLQAWEYDAAGNVTATWKGTDDKDDPEVVGRFDFSYDQRFEPTETTVTDPLGQATVYSVDYVGSRFRTSAINGPCPACGFGPETSFEYDDLDNPLLPTATVDGRGLRTELLYNADGRRVQRIEAAATPALARTTTWEYDANFPAFATSVQQPSVEPGELRTVTQVYDSVTGDLLSRTLDGFEGGLPLTGQVTTYTYEASGQTTTLDPPGFGTADETVFHYDDPNLNGQLPTRRTDPLLGDTHFEYDAFNRRTAVVDPNLLRTETDYDPLDRVTEIRRCEVAQPSDTCATPIGPVLVTTYVFSEFGDLFQTVLPEGNVIEYGYDDAGRITSIERKADSLPGTRGERTFFTLDGAGNRVVEELQSWDGNGWVTASQTAFEYSTRCRLDKVTAGLPGEESVTEYAYDCNGNLEKVWDPNHPSADQTEPPSTTYVYDELDRLVSVAQPWGGAGGGDVVTDYGYDVQDHLTSVNDAEGTVTLYEYSDRDLLTLEISEVSGTTEHTYDAHGELETSLDQRGVLTTRTLDVLDRVSQVTWSGDPSLTVDYTWDDPLVDYSLGRLTGIARNGTSVDYEYDAFGRMTRDGDLTYGYDGNGNRLAIGYPGAVVATYGYDFADRQETLEVQVGVDPPRPIVSAASYLPSGPLTHLTLGNGVTETRLFDSRYYPDLIEVGGQRSRTWDYQTDAVGNVTQIDDVLDCASSDLVLDDLTVSTTEVFESCGQLIVGPGFEVVAPGDVTLRAAGGIGFRGIFQVEQGAVLRVEPNADLGLPEMNSRTFGYQDFQYFLTSGDGPWGTLAWTYDQIGNRLNETRDGGPPDTYVYESNVAATGNLARLDQIQLGVGGIRDYTFGSAGHLEQVAAGANVVDFSSDEEGRLAGLERLDNTASMRYDGRSFLERVDEGATGNFTEPTYSSEGVLCSLFGTEDGGITTKRRHVLYFAERPVAFLEVPASGNEICTFLSPDHLGAPFIATDVDAAEIWSGGFEPFGTDWRAGAPDGAQENGVFLRLPGQWLDETWANASLGAGVHFNVHRWYEFATARYSRTDPVGLPQPEDFDDSFLNLFTYAASNPLLQIDPSGLITLQSDVPKRCRKKWQNKILPRLGKLAENPDCAAFFCTLSSDLPSLIQDVLPFIVVQPKQDAGRFRCDPLADPTTPPVEFGSDLVVIGKRTLCKSVKKALAVLIHELGHYADCIYNGNAIKPNDHSDGCQAEVACFGGTIGTNCPARFPRRK